MLRTKTNSDAETLLKTTAIIPIQTKHKQQWKTYLTISQKKLLDLHSTELILFAGWNTVLANA